MLPKEENISTGSHSAHTEGTTSIRRKVTPSTDGEIQRKSTKASLPTVTEAAASYITAKKLTWLQGSAKDIPPHIKQFVEIVREQAHCKDLRIDQLTREHIRTYYDTLKHLPFRTKGKTEYRGKAWLHQKTSKCRGLSD